MGIGMMTRRIFHASTLVAGMLMLFSSVPLTAQGNSSKPIVNHAVASGISAPLRDLAKLPATPQYGFHEANPVHRIPKRPAASLVDRVEQNTAGGPANYSIGINALGIGNGFSMYSVGFAPPDTNMAVGDFQLIQWVNLSWAVFDKSGNALTGPIDGNALWAALPPGSSCATQNSGDPIAQWDRFAHRWVLSQNVFTSPYAVCIAVSTSADATGTYYVYQFSVPGNGFPDYPKIGVWPTGYFQANNNFGVNDSGWVGAQVCAYNSAKLLAGDASAEQQCVQLTSLEDSLLPGDVDSPIPPPAGQDEFYIGSLGQVDNSHLSVYSFHVDFANPANSFVTGSGNSQLVSIASFTPACNGTYGGNCVPQKGVSDLLDSLGDRLMYRFAYYNDTLSFPTPKQHWYVNVDVTAAGGQNGVRWMEFATPQTIVNPTDLAILQQGTYAPDTNWRWMGSIARDQNNDVLLGYSESSATMYPSIFIAGRAPGDALGTLENEVSVVAGTGSQPDTFNRWGDYSSMRLDPVDNCTFWYTTEYYMVTQTFDWSTQIASAKFSGCPPVSIAQQFVPLPQPCRAVDTRPQYGGGGPIQGGTFQSFPIRQEGNCHIPTSAAAYSMNVSVVPQGPLGYLTVWPAGQARPLASTLNSLDGRIKANAAIVPAGYQGGISVYATQTTNVVLDIAGYFAPVSGSTLAFYPLPPCRVADTRHSGYPQGLGPPFLNGGQERAFPILNAATNCSIPTTGVFAYSLNFSVVPHGALYYMTVWPTGQSRPVVSTLNDIPGTIIANAAIVVAGTAGKVSVYPTNDTDLIIDINGYFAAAGTGGLSLYGVQPCRVIDTRHVGNGLPFSGTLSPPVDVVDSPCGIPSAAQAYVFNASVVPDGALGYLTLWPDGAPQPVVSTLNALDGSISSNMAIVPTNNGKVDAYASGITQLILDISGFFAP
jgi:hypothetical protein